MNVSQDLQPPVRTEPGVCWGRAETGGSLGGGTVGEVKTNLPSPYSHLEFPGGRGRGGRGCPRL